MTLVLKISPAYEPDHVARETIVLHYLYPESAKTLSLHPL